MIVAFACIGLACSGGDDVGFEDGEPMGGAGEDGSGASGRGSAGKHGGAGKGAAGDGSQAVDDGGTLDEDDAGPPNDGVVDASAPGKLCTSCGSCEEILDVASASHVVGTVDYASKPPAGGDHNDCWGTWGVHDMPLAVERWVHNQEHGGVIFLYNCPKGCAADVAALEALVEDKPFALLTQYDDMPARFAVVSWGHRLVSTCLDEAAFQAFYEANVDHAPESIAGGPPVGCPP